MRYEINPDDYLPLLSDSGLDDTAKRDLVAAVADIFIKLIDSAWQDDGFAHMKAAQACENAAIPDDSVVKSSVYKQPDNSARSAFEAAGATK